MKNNPLISKSINFAKNIIRLYEYLKNVKKEATLSKQLLRSGTSIGANIHEANYAVSKPDFIAKMQIALKECYESEYWLNILSETDYITDDFKFLIDDCGEIKRMLVATCTTAKDTAVKE